MVQNGFAKRVWIACLGLTVVFGILVSRDPASGQGFLERLPFGKTSSHFNTATHRTTSTALQSTVATPLTFARPGVALIIVQATDDAITGCTFCEIAIGVQPQGATSITEVPGTRKTYQCRNLIVGTSGVTDELPAGDHILHFLFKSNAGAPCQIRQRVITAIYAPFSD